MRPRISKHLSADAKKLVGLSRALFASGCRTEDRFWETRLETLLSKILRNSAQTTLNAALDHLQRTHPDAYSILAELAETQSESCTTAHEGHHWEAVLIAAPVLVWTRYTIPCGPLKPDTVHALRAHFQAHVLANGSRVALAPYLYSIEQLPHHHVETRRLAQHLAQAACTDSAIRLNVDDAQQASAVLADPRFLLAVAAVPAGQALFRWQEEENGKPIERDECLAQWSSQGGANLALALPGCELECLLPDAYYSACRNADARIRPAVLHTAVRYLEDTLAIHANELRAIIGGFGEHHVDEYRISFTRRGDNEVLHGVIWPLYGEENDRMTHAEEDEIENDPLNDITTLLKEAGITEIRRHPSRFEPEYCDDCDAPLYADSLGEIVHAEMTENTEHAPPHFH